jgi:uncharacterized protein YutE (UPF0331/DUF86 family)
MIDRQTICRRLHALETYVAELERLAAGLSRDDLQRKLQTQWAVEHGLQLAIECVLDVATHLVTAARLGAPESYRQAIELLGASGILPATFVRRVASMPGFRNVLVHDYLDVDLDIVWEMLQSGPAQFREFLRLVVAWLQKNAPE